MSADQLLDHAPAHPDEMARTSLRWAARLLLGGQLLFIVVTQLHTGGDANDHHSIFAAYAASGDWKGVHALQFLAVTAIVAGLVALASALERGARPPALAARIGAVLAAVSLALYAVLQAVDGIGNKQVDQAWTTASTSEQPARFADAESMRWLEWGMSSYHAYATGLALIALAVAAAVAGTAGLPRAVSSLMALTGVAYVAEGWVAGTRGFDALHSTFIVATWVLSLAWMAWLAITTGRAALVVVPRGRAS